MVREFARNLAEETVCVTKCPFEVLYQKEAWVIQRVEIETSLMIHRLRSACQCSAAKKLMNI